jgi:hypothetical protein
MATTAAPYGLRAVNLIGGQPYSGSTRQIKIASGYASNIFNGSVVQIIADGTIEMVNEVGAVGTAFPAGTIGVFVGCSYTDAKMGFIQSQYWPTGQVAADAVAYVVDDPRVVFAGQMESTGAQLVLGACTSFSAAQSTSTGSTATGNSTSALEGTVTTTADAFRIVGFVESTTSTAGDAYTDVLVIFNGVAHSYNNTTGI